jgi:hypothetical protein
MKKLKIFIAFFILTTSIFYSCKDDVEITSNNEKPSPVYDEMDVYYRDGHIFIRVGDTWYYGGTYRREWSNQISDCYMAESNCLPTTTITAPAPPPTFWCDLSQIVNDVNDDYGNNLINAVASGHNEIKDWYFNYGGNVYLDYPSAIESDLQNDSITIKVFNDQYFLVKYDASTYDDCPDW